MQGRRLSHYRILEVLATGGMGVVYRASDESLERQVAIKVLPDDALADDAARGRFRREALALSRLNHPHVNTIHEFGHADGMDFIVMELVEGETLEQRLLAGPLPEPEVRRLGIQIASALAAAHDAGVIHRDLKPSNIMLTARGDAKVLDFGIARRTAPATGASTLTLTEPGMLVGTVPYMAPEQLLSQAIDARTDVFALGCVLYEASTGKRAFEGSTQMAIASAILSQAPALPGVVRPGISRSLEDVVLRCLEKAPANRFQAASELVGALEHFAPVGTAHPKTTRSIALPAALVLAVVAGVIFAGFRLQGRPRPNGSGNGIRALAVLPFENLSNDPEQAFFAAGMADELITTLSQIGALKVISRSSSATYRDSRKPISKIGDELNVEALVTGSVQRVGNRVRVSTQLVEAANDRNLWADSFERDVVDILALQSELARIIAERIDVEIKPRERERLSAVRRVNPEAHEHYLRGRFHWNQFTAEAWGRSLKEFQAAVEIDPTYAAAYTGMSDAYALLSSNVIAAAEAMPRARAAALKALELDPAIPSGYASLGYVQVSFDHDWSGAEASFRKALELNPHEATALQNYGYLLHITGRFAEAERLFQRAREVDPLSNYVASQALWPLVQGGQPEKAIVEARKLLGTDSSAWYPRFLLGQSLAFTGRYPEAITEFERVVQAENIPMTRAWLGWAYGRAGSRDRAEAILRELETRARTEVVQHYAFALVHIGLGHSDEALSWLEKGVRDRTDEMVFLKVDVVWEPIRSDARFRQLLRELGLAG